MPFIGKQPEVGAYQLIDSITTSATATFALAVGGTAYFPASARNLLVSLNGITQAPDSAYTVSGSNIIFDSALTSSDVIDYILVMGDALDIGTPSDGTVGTAQMSYPLGNFSSTGIDDNATSTAITIDSSEQVGIGTSPAAKLHVGGTAFVDSYFSLRTTDDQANSWVLYTHTDDTFRMNYNGSGSDEVTIDTAGKFGIGTTSPNQLLTLGSSAGSATIGLDWETSNTTRGSILYNAGSGEMAFTSGYSGYGGFMTFDCNGAERMRITSGGDVFVGTSDTTLYNNSGSGNGGIALSMPAAGAGRIDVARDGNNMTLNRLDSDGEMVEFYRSGSICGKIEARSDDYLTLQVGSLGTGITGTASHNILPAVDNNRSDNTCDLGSNNFRWDDVYATNSSIQTSDAREKQDIEELTEAEARVAVAAKGLLRKYRWKGAVETKDNNTRSDETARIHFGIIAQDLQAAFEAEGLDAGKYGMFIHSTGTDEETGEEYDRMGIRYSELLAFIIAAI